MVALLADDSTAADGWSLSFRLAPGLAGDFRAVDTEMLRLNALAISTDSFSDRFVLGLVFRGGIAWRLPKS